MGAEKEITVIKQLAMQNTDLMSYFTTQSQLINIMFRRLVNVGVFLQDLQNSIDMDDEDIDTLKQLIEKYKLNEVIPQEDNIPQWH